MLQPRHVESIVSPVGFWPRKEARGDDEMIAARVRDVLADHRGITERRMFGGVAFMLRGNMACGVLGGEIIVRVGPDAYESALARPHTRVMAHTGRPMRGMECVAPDGFATRAALRAWLERGTSFAGSLPAK